KINGWSPLAAMVLGPAGTDFKVEPLSDPNLEISPTSGKTPALLKIGTRPSPNSGPSRVAHLDCRIQIGNSSQKLSGTLMFATWTTRFFEWTKDVDPRESEDNWKKIIGGQAICSEHGPSLDYIWNGSGPKAVHESGESRIVSDHFAMVAQTEINLPKGNWT